jgi:hypothetical protein
MANFLLPFHQPDRLEAGCDEAGRGCLAGPVYAAAVILPPDFYHPLLNDSKQMTESQRETLRAVIEQNALAWAVARAEPEEIDRINILHASFLAMHRALDGLATRPEFILVDGNRFRSYRDVPHLCVVKGDGSMPLSQRHLFWPKPIGMRKCNDWPTSSHTTTGQQTKATLPLPTGKPFGSTDSVRTTANRSGNYPKGNNWRFF